MAQKGSDRVGLFAALGCLALASGLAGVYLTRHQTGWVTAGNLVAALVFLVLAAAGAVSRARMRPGRLAWRVRTGALLEIALGLVAAAALLWAASRVQLAWDLTRPRTFTLSEFTRQVLARLDVDVEAFLIRPADAPARDRLLLDQYAAATSRFRVREMPPQVLDPEAQRLLKGRSQILLRSGDRTQRVPLAEEAYVTQALLSVTARSEGQVCFLTGHGEADPRSRDPRGLGRFTATLEREGFQVSPLLLAAEPAVPESCRVVVVAAPERGFLEVERQALESFWEQGGRLLVFLEPGRIVELAGLMESLGIRAPEATVVDQEASLFGSQTPGRELLVNRFVRHHPVTQGLQEQTRVVFSGVRPLQVLTQDASGFVFSEPLSRLESTSGEALPDQGGSFALGASVERVSAQGGAARLVVFGDLDLAANRLFGVLYNRDLVMNAVYWLAGREADAGVRPKVEDLYQAPLVPERAVAAYHSVVLLVPEAIVAFGILFWHRRRRL